MLVNTIFKIGIHEGSGMSQDHSRSAGKKNLLNWLKIAEIGLFIYLGVSLERNLSHTRCSSLAITGFTQTGYCSSHIDSSNIQQPSRFTDCSFFGHLAERTDAMKYIALVTSLKM